SWGHHFDVVVWVVSATVVEEPHAPLARVDEHRLRIGVQFRGHHLPAVEVPHRTDRLVEFYIRDIPKDRVDLLQAVSAFALAESREAHRRHFDPTFPWAFLENLEPVRAEQDSLRTHFQFDWVPQFGAALSECLFDALVR